MNTRLLFGSALIALACAAASAHAETGFGVLTKDDHRRIQQYDATRATALSEARAGGGAADVRVLEGALAGDALPFKDVNLAGAWRCRIIKAGGNLPLVAYPWFDCRITRGEHRYFVEKLTGSQRTSGWLIPQGDARMLYVGAGHYHYEKPRGYMQDTQQDQVAYVFRRGPSRLVFEFPDPKFESKLDIMVLEKIN